MLVDDVLTQARAAREAGASRFCMGAAWRNPKDRDLATVNEMIRGVKALGLETCATLGMLSEDQALSLSEAGLDYYNHNIDTAPEFSPVGGNYRYRTYFHGGPNDLPPPPSRETPTSSASAGVSAARTAST